MVSVKQSIDLATEIMNSISNFEDIDEDDRQDIYLMIISDFQYLKELEESAARSLLERTIRAYILRPKREHYNFKDGLGFNLYINFNPSSISFEVKNIIDHDLYPEEKDVIVRLFGLDGNKQESIEDISISTHKTQDEIRNLYNTSLSVIRMLLNVV